MKNDLINHSNVSLLDIIQFDITQFFNGDYQIVNTEDSPAVQIVDYERDLSTLEFDFFDTLHLMVMFDKYCVDSDTHMNATFKSKNKEIPCSEIQRITNTLHDFYGADDSKHVAWSQSDIDSYQNNSFTRIWPTGMGDSFVKLSYKEKDGLLLTILFLNNMLDFVGKKIFFN